MSCCYVMYLARALLHPVHIVSDPHLGTLWISFLYLSLYIPYTTSSKQYIYTRHTLDFCFINAKNLSIIGEQNCQKLDECLICAFLIWCVFVVFIFVIFVVSLSNYTKLCIPFCEESIPVYRKAVVWVEAQREKD